MNILKKLFSKKQKPVVDNSPSDIQLPVKITRHQGAYIKALLDAFLEVEDFDALKKYGEELENPAASLATRPYCLRFLIQYMVHLVFAMITIIITGWNMQKSTNK